MDDFYNIDSALSEEERAVRDSVRAYVDEHVLPIIGKCYIDGRFPKEIIPGLADYNSKLGPINLAGGGAPASQLPALNGEVVESKLTGMLTELQGMSRSLGSLKALQEVDFSGTQQQIQQMNGFYSKLTEAMANMSDAMEDTRMYKEQMAALNKNLGSLNAVYGGMLSAMSNVGR